MGVQFWLCYVSHRHTQRRKPFKFKHQSCVSAFLFTLAKPVAKSATPVGSSTALSMESNLMVTCHLTRLSGTTLSKLFSLKLDVVPIDNFSIQNSSLMAKKMPLTIMQGDTTP